MRVHYTEFSKKFEDLKEFVKRKDIRFSAPSAGLPRNRDVFRHFNPLLDIESTAENRDAVESEIKGLEGNLGQSFSIDSTGDTTNKLCKWLDSFVTPKIGFDSSVEEFCSLDHATWRTHCNQNFLHTIQPRARSQPDVVFIDPESHASPPPEPWDSDGIVDQRYMYYDHHAPTQWQEFHGREEYGFYGVCKDLIKESSKRARVENKQIEQLVILGAGSPDKDWILIQSVAAFQDIPPEVFICDASFFMLMETKQELTKLIGQSGRALHGKKIVINLCCFDFTEMRGWSKIGIDPQKPKLISILGGTFGNVSEKAMLDRVTQNTGPGDLFLLAGSFYETAEQLVGYEKSMGGQYDDSGKSMTLNPLGKFLDKNHKDLSFVGRIDLVEVDFESAEDLEGKVESKISGTKAAVFWIPWAKVKSDQGPRYLDRLILFTSRRYILAHLRDHLEKRGLIFIEGWPKMVEPPGAPTDGAAPDEQPEPVPYWHLLFKRGGDAKRMTK